MQAGGVIDCSPRDTANVRPDSGSGSDSDDAAGRMICSGGWSITGGFKGQPARKRQCFQRMGSTAGCRKKGVSREGLAG